MSRALLVALVCLVAAPSAHAQDRPTEDNEPRVRFAVGLDYAGLAGRGDGGAGGFRLQLGARVHEYLAVYWQGRVLVGGFVGGDDTGAGLGLGWNTAMAELNLGIFQFGAGPSVDYRYGCQIDGTQGTTTLACSDAIAPGLATRAGFRFGTFAFSGDMHVSFEETGPMVWVSFGVALMFGDVAREPMRFATSDHDSRRETAELDDEDLTDPFLASAPPRPRATTPGRRLDDPWDEVESQRWILGEGQGAEPVEPEIERWSPFSSPPVRPTRVTRSAPATRAGSAPARSSEPSLGGDLEFDDSDDPIGGLEDSEQ